MLVARHLARRLPSSASCGLFAKAYAASSVAHLTKTSSISAVPIRPSLVAASEHLPSRRTFSSSSSSSSLKENYDYILVERRLPSESDGVVGGGVGIVTLHRPKALNALSDGLFEDLIHAVRAFEADDDIGCIVITGSGKAFAAGELLSLKWIYCAELLRMLTIFF